MLEAMPEFEGGRWPSYVTSQEIAVFIRNKTAVDR
jgi:hypothetical protein